MKDFNLNHLTYNQLLVEQDAAVIGTSYSIAVGERLMQLEKLDQEVNPITAVITVDSEEKQVNKTVALSQLELTGYLHTCKFLGWSILQLNESTYLLQNLDRIVQIELTNLQKETTNMNESSNLLSLLSDSDLEAVYDALCDASLYDSSGYTIIVAESNRRFKAKKEEFAVSSGLTVFQVDQIKSLESNIELWGNKLAYLVPHRQNELNNWKEQLTAIYDAARINLKLQASYAAELAPEVNTAPEVITTVQPSMEELHSFTLVWYQLQSPIAVNSLLYRYGLSASFNVTGQLTASFVSTYSQLHEITAILELIGLAPDDCIQAHSYS